MTSPPENPSPWWSPTHTLSLSSLSHSLYVKILSFWNVSRVQCFFYYASRQLRKKMKKSSYTPTIRESIWMNYLENRCRQLKKDDLVDGAIPLLFGTLVCKFIPFMYLLIQSIIFNTKRTERKLKTFFRNTKRKKCFVNAPLKKQKKKKKNNLQPWFQRKEQKKTHATWLLIFKRNTTINRF